MIYFQNEHGIICNGDCLDVMKGIPDNSFDSIVTDPPYGLSFMGKKWDYDVPSIDIWKECLRVLKPGGHLLAFAGTRTQHRMAVRIEDAGFQIRDMIAWVYGSGFPKSLNIGKAVDKLQGNERKVVGKSQRHGGGKNFSSFGESFENNPKPDVTKGTSEWEGWGTALKPALEPITVARKPLSEKTVVDNVLKYGTGGINIDDCRVEFGNESDSRVGTNKSNGTNCGFWHSGLDQVSMYKANGRFPANLIHDGSNEVLQAFSNGDSGKPQKSNNLNDNISSARFFYCAKASKSERNAGCERLPMGKAPASARSTPAKGRKNALGSERQNHHPTVKPIKLMRYLCKLVTPPGGTVLDPFLGSGSTAIGAMQESFGFFGIQKETEYCVIAENRIKHHEKIIVSKT